MRGTRSVLLLAAVAALAMAPLAAAGPLKSRALVSPKSSSKLARRLATKGTALPRLSKRLAKRATVKAPLLKSKLLGRPGDWASLNPQPLPPKALFLLRR